MEEIAPTVFRHVLWLNRLCLINWNLPDQTLRTLCGGTIDEAAADESRPSVILRVCPAGTALWELAKEYAARAESIAGANHLTGDTVPEEMLLLIPM